MAETDWQGLSDARFEKSATILELVESLADESSVPERTQGAPRRVPFPLRGLGPDDPQLHRPLQEGRSAGFPHADCQ